MGHPNSDWVCELVTNATFFINRIIQHPIGCVGVNLPIYLKRNKAVVGLEKDHHNATYNDNRCLFRCLGLHQGCDVRRLEATVATLYAKDTGTAVHDFAGVTLDELSKIEAQFEVNVVVNQLVKIATNGKTTAELVRWSTAQYPDPMYVNLHETHYSFIKDIHMYNRSWRCRNCVDSLWERSWELHRHERTCEAGVNRVYKGGVYRPSPSVCQRLDDEGIFFDEALRYYHYRASFDFETTNLPPDSATVQWTARHVPLSVSLASNAS